MTLTKKLISSVLLLLFIVFIGTYVITVKNSRHFYQQQLYNNAQDTATSLGLSLSQSIQRNDKAMMLSMVQAVFDQGYFSLIAVYNNKNELVVSRELKPESSTVPEWFISLISWPSTSQKNVIMDGWKQSGYLVVSTDPEVAYLSIWRNAKQLFYWYVLFALITSLLFYFAVRFIMSPLSLVTKQAKSICERRYVTQSNIPNTPELKKLTLAMNRMVAHVKTLFSNNMKEIQRLRHDAYVDPLTKLGNRRYFLQQFSYLLSNKDEFCPGYFILVSLDGLEDLNIESGYLKGDEVIVDIAHFIQSFWSIYSQILTCRISGSEFGIIIKDASKSLIAASAPDFSKGLQNIVTHLDSVQLYFAALSYEFEQTTSEILTKADDILGKARIIKSSYRIEMDDRSEEVVLAPDDLRLALAQEQFVISQQPVCKNNKPYHQELYLRLVYNNEDLSAYYFLPIAERAGLSPLIDTLMIQQVNRLVELTSENYAINLSLNSITEPESRKRIIKELKLIPCSKRSRVSVEIPEVWLISHESLMKSFIDQVLNLDFQFGIDQAGVMLSTMDYLQEIPLSYVKIHGSLIHDAVNSSQSEMMLHYLVDLLETVGTDLIATQVQSGAQKSLMLKLGITLLQGYEIASSEKVAIS